MKVMTLKRAAKFVRAKAKGHNYLGRVRCLVLVPPDQMCPPNGWKGCDWQSSNLWQVAIFKDGQMVYVRTFE